MYKKIVSIENLFSAWKEFLRGKHQRPDVQTFTLHLEDNLFSLHEQLRSGTWQHGPYERFTVSDPKPRIIHKATVADRVVHHAIVRVLEPIFDHTFIYDSWSCRKSKGNQAAVFRLHRELERLSVFSHRPVWTLKCDIRKYFASVDHEVLLDMIERRVRDTQVFCLIEKVVRNFTPGLPLGNLTSQLFANVYLNPLDHYVIEILRPLAYLRYCDDFVLTMKTPEMFPMMLGEIRRFLRERLKLELHPDKISLRPYYHGVDWLGYVLYPGYRVLRNRTRSRMWRAAYERVGEYLNHVSGTTRLRSTLSSYHGLLLPSWNDGDRRRMGEWWECL